MAESQSMEERGIAQSAPGITESMTDRGIAVYGTVSSRHHKRVHGKSRHYTVYESQLQAWKRLSEIQLEAWQIP